MSSQGLADLHLADLHARASELGVAGFRLMQRDDLVTAIEDAAANGGESPGVERGPALAPAEPLSAPEPELGVIEDELEPDTDELPLAGTLVEEGTATDPAESEEAAEPAEPEVEAGPGVEAETAEITGTLELTRQRFGFLRVSGIQPDPDDVYISASQVRRCELRTGDRVSGPARPPRGNERHRALVHVDRVNGEEPLAEPRPDFDDLEAVLSDRRVPLDPDRDDVLTRAVDLLAPLALGQRVLVRAAARSGRTTLLRGICRALGKVDGAQLVVLLVDERPEEATQWRQALPEAEFANATAELAPREQFHVADLALERARRIAESGGDAVLICDSLSRLAVAKEDAGEVKRLFGSGRNLAGPGSLTVVGTVLSDGRDDGRAERAVATTESSLITLDAALAAAGVVPAIRAAECRVSNEDQLRDASELAAVRRLRSLLADLDPAEAAGLLRERIEGSGSNAELIASL